MTGVPTFVEPSPIGDLDPSRVLFLGLGQSAVCWYRCALPAMFMGADWVGLAGDPPHVGYLTGLVKGQTILPALDDYDVVVIQQPRRGWLKVVRRLQAKGVKVIFEIDDYVHAIRKMQDHDFKHDFGLKHLAELELLMGVCDAMICSTEYVARRYRKFNKRTYVCENGVDLARYRLTRPPRPMVHIGWAGGTGHERSMMPWLNEVGKVLRDRPATAFVSIGMNFADAFEDAFPTRSVSIPFTLVDTYPSAMTMIDVALAPAGPGNFFKGKSDLRWVEAGALGIPIVADPEVYPRIEHRVTGFHASTPEEMRELVLELVDSPELRTEVGANAKEYVTRHRDMRVAVRQWERVFADVLEAETVAG